MDWFQGRFKGDIHISQENQYFLLSIFPSNRLKPTKTEFHGDTMDTNNMICPAW
jgi:hypothetical protein